MEKINNPLDKVIGTVDIETAFLMDELYTVKEIANMLKTSKQHVGKLLKKHNIKTINIATGEKKATYRISKNEVMRLKEELEL